MSALALIGGRVWTGGGLGREDGRRPATALAIEAGRVAHVGSDDEVRNGLRPGARTIDLRGRWVQPGFVDAHTHFIDGGLQLATLDVRGVTSIDAFVSRVRDAAESAPTAEWITGGNWDEQLWGGALPTRAWLDRAAPNHPVYLIRSDLHMAVANTEALRRAGILEDTVDPPGGRIDRDAEGRATGVVRDRAMALVAEALPTADEAAFDGALDRATSHALSLGVTQVHDMGQWGHFETYRRAHGAKGLGLRVYSAVQMPDAARLLEVISEEGRGDELLWWGAVKAFVDGSLGSSTAWFHHPYHDDPESSGLVVTDLDELRDRIAAGARAGLQPIVHAIGDRANDWLLDVYEHLARTAEARGAGTRPRIEHAQHLSPGASARFAGAGVVASVQPAHVADDGPWAEQRIGAERVGRSYAFRSLLDDDATVAFGSDWTVAPLDPRLGLEAAVRRATRGREFPNGWVPEQKIEAEQALIAYTSGAACAGCAETWTGRLAPGMCADVVVLSSSPLEWLEGREQRPEVDLTLVDGHIKFDRRRDG